MKTQTLAGLGLAVLALAGCQSASQTTPAGRDGLIEDGKTTIQEVKAQLGVPALSRTPRGGKDAEYFTDFHCDLTPEGRRMLAFTAEPGIVRFKSMSFLFSKEGILQSHFEYHSGLALKGRPLESGPRLRFGPPLDPATIGQIQHGKTGEKELVGWLGEPALEFLSPDQRLTLVWIEGGLDSSTGRQGSFQVLSVILNDRGIATRHATMETGNLNDAMNGLILP